MASSRYMVITGGIGGAKLARGLAARLSKTSVTFVVNTGDDFEHLGLYICPDIDTLLYTLAEKHNPVTGWGRRDESWKVMEAMKELGGDTWFQLGDSDLALNLQRTGQLAIGKSLSDVTVDLAKNLGVQHTILPASDDPVRTLVETADGEVAFQDYFVLSRCEMKVLGFRYHGAENACLNPALLEQFNDPQLKGIIICPSNPYLSIDPILAVPGIRDAIRHIQVPVIAVSPIIGGESVKGPLAKIMRELSVPVNATTVAEHYQDLLDGFVLDDVDQQYENQIRSIGLEPLVTETLMSDMDRSKQLADDCLDFIMTLSKRARREVS